MTTIAEELAKQQKSISVAEFFERNRHLVGFDSKRKAISTCVKEAVDNSLDACEEYIYGLMERARKLGEKKETEIKEEMRKSLPEITIKVDEFQKEYKLVDSSGVTKGYLILREDNVNLLRIGEVEQTFERSKLKSFEMKIGERTASIDRQEDKSYIIKLDNPKEKLTSQEVSSSRYKITVIDNGPGIVKDKIPNIFGSLLYGSKFHRLKQSRGQQGIGISASVLYAQLTTGKPATITSKTGPKEPVYEVQLVIDVTKNQPSIVHEEKKTEFEYEHGTKVELIVEGVYFSKGDKSVYEYLRRTAISNPHAKFIFIDPEGNKILFSRITNEPPTETVQIKPHPHGLELGTLLRLLKTTDKRTIVSFLTNDLSRIGGTTAKLACKKAKIDPGAKPQELQTKDADNLLKTLQQIPIMKPQLDCLSPIGEDKLEKSLRTELKPEFVCTITRKPEVYRGMPFLIEVGLAYGGEAIKDLTIMRYANKVPLLYHQSSCVIASAISEVDWRRYNLQQQGGRGMPQGQIAVAVHMASVWVPFTSEGKEAIAQYPVIKKEIKLALMECARKLDGYLRKLHHAKRQQARMNTFVRYAGELSESLHILTEEDEPKIRKELMELIQTKVKGVELEE